MDFSSFVHSADSPVSRFFLARHLDSPLIADGLLEDVNQVKEGAPVSKTARGLRFTAEKALSTSDGVDRFTTIDIVRRRVQRDLTLLTPLQLLDCVDTLAPVPCSADDEETTSRVWSDALKACFSSDRSVDVTALTVTAESKRWLDAESALESLWWKCHRLCAQGQTAPVTASILTSLGSKMTIDRHKLLIHGDEGAPIYYGSFDMFLAMKDCCGVRGRSYLAAEFFYPGGRLAERITTQITWQRGWIELFGNDGYELAKQTESLSKAWLTSLTDDIFTVNGPMDKMMMKITDKIRKITKDDPIALASAELHLKGYAALLEECTVQETVELFGLQKLCMFPFIYSARGGASAAKEALEDADITDQNASELRACWCSSFTAGYIAKNHRWPTLVIPDYQVGSALHRWYTTNRQDISARDFDLEDWRGVRFSKNLDFDYHDNYLDLIDDKAISYYRDELRSYWDGADFASSDRRLLLEMLSRDHISIKDICEIVRLRQVPLVWKVVSLYPKEKELKVNARMFSMMVLEMRTFFTCLESNLAKEVFPYLNAQTMTKDKVSIAQRFYRLTSPKDNTGIIRLFFECDLSRWNLRWRDKAVRPIAEDLNDLFGTPGLFTYVHEFFFDAVIVVRTPRLRPEGVETVNPTASDLVWYNHQGGFEGIAQKLWSICTFAMIDRGMRNLDCSYVLIGQGDNQVLSVEVARDESASIAKQCQDLSALISNTLTVACKEVNQDLKPEECLESRTVITYSKNLYINGAEFFTSVKFAARLFAQTNNEIPSLSGDLAGLSSACIAAAEYNVVPARLGVLQSFFLTRELKTRLTEDAAELSAVPREHIIKARREIRRLARLLLFTPVHFGGLSIATPIDFLYRGGGDPTAKDWSWIVRGGATLSEVGSCKLRALKGTIFSERADPLRLLEAPYCLPLTPLSSQRAAADKLTEAYVVGQSRNRDVLALTTDAVADYRRALHIQLLSVTPCNPLLISEAYSSSACAEVDRLKRMFTATRTVQTASRRSGHDSSGALLHMSGSEAMYRFSQLLDFPLTGTRKQLSAKEEMRYLRSFRARWRRSFEAQGLPFSEIVGVESMPPALLRFHISAKPTSVSGIKTVVIPCMERRSSRGPFDPYLGAATQSTRTEHGYKIIGDSRPSKSTDRLSQLIHTPGMSDTVQEVFRQISRHRTAIDPARDELKTRQIGGTMHHRFVASRKEMGAYVCGTGNLATWMFFITDEIQGVSGSVDDYALMFQESFVYSVGLANLFLHQRSKGTDYWEIVLETTSDDLLLVPDENYDVDFVVELEPEESWNDSKMIYDGSATIRTLTGPVAEEHTYTECSADDLPTALVVREALRATTSDALRAASSRGFSSRLSRDNPPRLRLDVAELSRVQLRGLIDAAARSIVLSVCHRWLSQLVDTEFVASTSLGVRQLSLHYAAAIEPAIDYSAVLDDDSLGYSVLHAEYSHSQEYPSPSASLESAIATEARRLLSLSPARLGPTILFQSEASGSGSAFLLARIGHALHHYARTSLRLAEVSDALYAGRLVEAMSKPREASRQRRILSSLRKASESAGVSRALGRVLHRCRVGESLLFVPADHKVCLRLVRHIAINQVATGPSTSGAPTLQIVRIESLYNQFIDAGQFPPDAALTFHRTVRLVGAPSGQYGRMYSVWYSLIAQLQPSSVCLVGVGNGVVALAALELHVRSIVGCDIGSAYNIKAIRRNFPPPAIAAHSQRRRFSWSPATLLNIRAKTSLADSVLRGVDPDGSSDMLVVIDIRPYPSERELLEALDEVPDHLNVLVHLCAVGSEIPPHLGRLCTLYNCSIYEEHRVGSERHFFLSLSSPSGLTGAAVPRPLHAPSTLYLSGVALVVRPTDLGQLYAIANRLCGGLCGCNFSMSALTRLCHDFESECGRSEFSVSYADWTPVVKKYEYAQCIRDPSRLIRCLPDWCLNGQFFTTITGDGLLRHSWSRADFTKISGPLAWLIGVRLNYSLPD